MSYSLHVTEGPLGECYLGGACVHSNDYGSTHVKVHYSTCTAENLNNVSVLSVTVLIKVSRSLENTEKQLFGTDARC